jgi:hypothetical protein
LRIILKGMRGFEYAPKVFVVDCCNWFGRLRRRGADAGNSLRRGWCCASAVAAFAEASGTGTDYAGSGATVSCSAGLDAVPA